MTKEKEATFLLFWKKSYRKKRAFKKREKQRDNKAGLISSKIASEKAAAASTPSPLAKQLKAEAKVLPAVSKSSLTAPIEPTHTQGSPANTKITTNEL